MLAPVNTARKTKARELSRRDESISYFRAFDCRDFAILSPIATYRPLLHGQRNTFIRFE